MEMTFVKGSVNECCDKAENLERQPESTATRIVDKCKICRRIHRTMKVEPGMFGMTLIKK